MKEGIDDEKIICLFRKIIYSIAAIPFVLSASIVIKASEAEHDVCPSEEELLHKDF